MLEEQAEIAGLQAQLQETQAQLERTNSILAWIQTSKFWKIRAHWVKLKQLFSKQPEPVADFLNTSSSDTRTQFQQPISYDTHTPKERIAIVFDNPSEMSIAERIFLYALVRGTQPERVLEIGSRHGGSAAIVTSAMEENGTGILVGLDPSPEITLPQELFHGRFHLIAKPSPEAIPKASRVANGPFDLVFIDGIHIYEQAKKDIEGCLPYLAPGGYILFHDAFNFGVSEAIREAIESNSTFFDCGYVCTTPNTWNDLLAYGGLRLVRVGSSALVDPQPSLVQAYHQAGKSAPPRDPDLLNHDPYYYCKFVKPCSYCQKNGEF